jgi:hypothetical protein
MKTLLLALTITLSSIAGAADFYAEAYRFDDVNHTGVLGVQGDRWGGELSLYDGGLSLTHRSYLEFTNIEIGSEFELTNKAHKDALDYRVIDIEGGYSLISKPYIKVGSNIFAILSIDETNAPILKVGFNLW